MPTEIHDALPDILLVDDDTGSLLVMNKALEGDYSIRFATSGTDALELIATHPPDLVLLDMVLPEMDGIQILNQLKGSEATRHIPVLFVTARSDAATETQALKAGADDFIHKPINPDVLMVRVASHLERSELRRAIEHQRDRLEAEVQERTLHLEAARVQLEERVAVRTAELRESNQQLELALAAAHLGIWDYEASTGCLSWSERQTAMLGFPRAQHCSMLRDLRPVIHPTDRRACLRALHRSLRDGVTLDQVYRVVWPDGSEHWLHSMGKAILETQDEAGTRLIGTTRDITTLMEHQNQLERMAHYDALTSLPNRVLLSTRLRQAMASARRRKLCLGVVYLDLDGFKSINDTHGHTVGDELLIAVSRRMRQTLREVDTLARLGGDEFAAILVDLGDRNAYAPLLARLLAAASEPVEAAGRRLRVTASLGVTIFPQAAEVDGDQLLRQADQAMYQAKQTGRNRYQVSESAG